MYDKSIFENEKIWHGFAYVYFILRTLALAELVDVFIFGRPLVTLFLLVFGVCYYVNLKLYKLLKKYAGRSRVLRILFWMPKFETPKSVV